MKIFVYKTLFISFVIFILFHLTFGYLIKSYEKKFYNNFSSQKLNEIKEKSRKEIRNAIEKDKILNEEDAQLLKKFLEKIRGELK
tara:strand:- start:154 stop:408 length:255 start_codon:yes stop_codon:yes gene_type:complete